MNLQPEVNGFFLAEVHSGMYISKIMYSIKHVMLNNNLVGRNSNGVIAALLYT